MKIAEAISMFVQNLMNELTISQTAGLQVPKGKGAGSFKSWMSRIARNPFGQGSAEVQRTINLFAKRALNRELHPREVELLNALFAHSSYSKERSEYLKTKNEREVRSVQENFKEQSDWTTSDKAEEEDE